MAFVNPTFNLKTGVDSDIIVAREDNNGKIVYRKKFFRGPYLLRRTGDSLTGTTESIESNELRHGRTRSAPRKGTSSSSGSLDIEFSPESFDDMLEATWRGEWRLWTSDTESPSNKDKSAFKDGYFNTKCSKLNAGPSGKKLLRKWGELGTYRMKDGEYVNEKGEVVAKEKAYLENTEGLYEVSDPSKFVIHELNPQTSKIQYSILKKFGGQDNEDMFQEYTHVAMNTFELTVAVNSIITGSFGTMGLNNPKILRSADAVDSKGNKFNDADKSIEKELGGRLAERKDGTEIDLKEEGAALEAGREYLKEVPEKAVDTMQLTAREGSFYVNGKRVRFANNLTFNINNNLSSEYAIFESQAISTRAGMLDINGDLTTYLVHDNDYAEDGADELYNAAVDDETIELLFCLQDKLGDNQDNLPTAMYIFQIFNCKHTDIGVNGNGEESMEVSLPWQSFNEQACRIFRCLLGRPVNARLETGATKEIILIPNVDLTDFAEGKELEKLLGLKVTVSMQVGDDTTDFAPLEVTKDEDGVITATGITVEKEDSVNFGYIRVSTGDIEGLDEAIADALTKEAATIFTINVEWNGQSLSKSASVKKVDEEPVDPPSPPAPKELTGITVEPASKEYADASDFAKSDFTVKAQFDDGSEETVAEDDWSYDSDTVGAMTSGDSESIEFAYSGKTTNVTISIS